jgi:hypothetical protein
MTIHAKSVQRFAALGLGTQARNQVAGWEAMAELVVSGQLVPMTETSINETTLKAITDSPQDADKLLYSAEGVCALSEYLLALQRDLAAFCRGEFPQFNYTTNWEADWAGIPLQTKQALLNASSIKLADVVELSAVRMWCADYLINSAARLLAPGGFSELVHCLKNVNLDSTGPVLLETPSCMMTALGLPKTDEWRRANTYVAAILDGFLISRSLFLTLFVWNILCAMYGKEEEKITVFTKIGPPTSVKRNVEIRRELGQVLSKDEIAELASRRLDLNCVRCGITGTALKSRAGGRSLAGCSGCAEHSVDSLQTSPVVYCSKECQKAHWKVHKPVCGKTRATLLRYDDGTLRSRALIRQIEKLQCQEAIAKGIDYLLFTTGENGRPDIGIIHTAQAAPQARAHFKEVRTCAFTNRHATAEVLCLYEMLKAQLPDFGGIFTDAELRSQLKAEYGFDPLEVKDAEATKKKDC